MNPNELFQNEVKSNIDALGQDKDLQALSRVWVREVAPHKYSYNFSWLGRPIIQFPQDMIALQEIMWRVQPDVVVETGIAHGGSLIYIASILELIAACGGPSDAFVVGVDIDIRAHNRDAIESHPLSRRVKMVEGSSIDPATIANVVSECSNKKILVSLDSNHTHEHVLSELNAYAPLVSPQSYCVVFDTLVEDLPASLSGDRPWSPGNSPKTAVHAFLKEHPEFEIDKSIDHKLLISVAPDGWLKRVS